MYPVAFRTCRIAHNPRPLYRNLANGVRERTELCRRCGRTRTFLIDQRGYRLSTRDNTWYPPGYLTPKSGLVKRDFAALEYNADYDKAVIEGRILSGDDNVTDLHSA